MKKSIKNQMKTLDPNLVLIEMPISADPRSMKSLVKESMGSGVEPLIVFTIDLESWERIFKEFTKPMATICGMKKSSPSFRERNRQKSQIQ